jgi:hypothetical protein
LIALEPVCIPHLPPHGRINPEIEHIREVVEAFVAADHVELHVSKGPRHSGASP